MCFENMQCLLVTRANTLWMLPASSTAMLSFSPTMITMSTQEDGLRNIHRRSVSFGHLATFTCRAQLTRAVGQPALSLDVHVSFPSPPIKKAAVRV